MLCRMLFLSVIYLVGGPFLSAQNTVHELSKKADRLYLHQRYHKAIKIYEQLLNIRPDADINYLYLADAYKQTNKLKKAQKELIQLLNKKKSVDKLAYLYLAEIEHLQSNYKDAIRFYKLFLRSVGQRHERSAFAIDQIKRAGIGIQSQYAEQFAYVDNLGRNINSHDNELLAVYSPNQANKIYFSSDRFGSIGGLRNQDDNPDNEYGSARADMYGSEQHQSIWGPIFVLNPLLNSQQAEYLLGFSPQGKMLYFERQFKGKSAVMVDTFVSIHHDAQPKTGVSVLSDFGIDHIGGLHFFDDTTLIFSSRSLPNGYGGYDLYIIKNRAGQWSEPQNLGPVINSRFDEVSPFLTRDGRQLYFSSNNTKSIGGFDIFSTRFVDKLGTWQTPTNLNAPINSPADDSNFKLSNDGATALFCSKRSSGYGGWDIYSAFFKKSIISHQQRSMPPSFDLVEHTNQDDLDHDEQQTLFQANEVSDFEIKPLAYNENDVVLSVANIKSLERYINLLKSYPEISILLSAHADGRDPKQFDLYFSIKRAEKLAKYLVSKGVPKSRILLRGLGSQYPLANLHVRGELLKSAQKLNRRVDVDFLGTKQVPIRLVKLPAKVSKNLKTHQDEQYAEKQRGLSYRVFITRMSQPFLEEFFVTGKDIMVQKFLSDTNYEYYIGLFKNYHEAARLKSQIIAKGHPMAAVKVYLDGIELSASEIVALEKDYPELRFYLERN